MLSCERIKFKGKSKKLYGDGFSEGEKGIRSVE